MKQLALRRADHRPDGTLPLINIVLLLVLAFMIAGTVSVPLPDGFQPLETSDAQPEHADGELVLLTMAADGRVIGDEGDLDKGSVANLLRSDLAKAHGVTIRVDARIPASRVLSLLAAAEDAGVANAVIVTMDRVQ
ncbi:MAG: biopolymer transporter ExbD [Pseudomonadota bacterium]